MERLAEALRQVRAPAVELPLVLSCEPTIAMRWLIPRLPAFRERFPQHQIHLLTAGDRWTLRAIGWISPCGATTSTGAMTCHAEPVAPELTGPVCSPAVAQAGTAGLPSASQAETATRRTRPTAWQRGPSWAAQP